MRVITPVTGDNSQGRVPWPARISTRHVPGTAAPGAIAPGSLRTVRDPAGRAAGEAGRHGRRRPTVADAPSAPKSVTASASDPRRRVPPQGRLCGRSSARSERRRFAALVAVLAGAPVSVARPRPRPKGTTALGKPAPCGSRASPDLIRVTAHQRAAPFGRGAISSSRRSRL